MSNKPKLRFKEFNDEWKEYSMDSCGSFLKGNNLSKADLTNTGYPCLLYGELYTKYSEITTNILSCTNRLESNQAVGMINDVLLPSSGETAIDISTATCLQVDNVLLGGDLNIFRPNKQDGRFISYELNHKKRKKIACIAQGATVVHLYPNYLKKVKLSLPSINEQSKIAEFLSKVDEVIAEREEEVKDLEQQKKGLMQKIFSQQIRFTDSNNNPYPDWEEKKLKDFATLINGRAYKQSELLNSGKYPVLRVGNFFTNGDWYYSDLQLDSDKYANNGDLLYAWSASFGPRIWNGDKVIYHYHIWKVMIENAISKMFLLYLLEKDVSSIKAQMNGGIMMHITKENMEDRKFLLPCLEEQQKIANILSKLDELIEEKKALLSDWQQFKKGLLQQMFV